MTCAAFLDVFSNVTPEPSAEIVRSDGLNFPPVSSLLLSGSLFLSERPTPFALLGAG